MTARAVAAALALLALQAPAARAERLAVTSDRDSGARGTLRWAIARSNATAARDEIVIARSAGVIAVRSELPHITRPVLIRGAGGRVGIDGSSFIDLSTPTSCPGADSGFGTNVRTLTLPGLAAVDTSGVEVRGLFVRGFCIGILGVRSHDLVLHDNWLQDNVGGAGIMVTGDDGAGGSTSASFHNVVARNVFYNNGDGMEYTRGTRDSVAEHNVFLDDEHAPAGVQPSQAVEFPSADGDALIANRVLGGFSDGFQVNGSNNRVEGNSIAGVVLGVTLNGTGNRVIGNVISGTREGVAFSRAGNVVSRNSISHSGADLSLCFAGGICSGDPTYGVAILGIDVGARGVTPNDAGDADDTQNFPVLADASSWTGRDVTLSGSLSSRPGQTYTIELFASRAASPSGYGEGERFLGSTTVTTDPAGEATFSASVSAPPGWRSAAFSATATGATTSEFGRALVLERG